MQIGRNSFRADIPLFLLIIKYLITKKEIIN